VPCGLLPGAALVGEKLSESRASDVRELCNTLLSAYLIQLLDTGLLHADPHPGNLIRTGTPSGLLLWQRLC
jgi:aarF domain-containing kinase